MFLHLERKVLIITVTPGKSALSLRLTKTQNNFITNILYPFHMSSGVEMYIFLELKYECAFQSSYL